MLTVPAYLTTQDGVTVFVDDTLFYLFYPVAAAPAVRLDKNGDPNFLLVKYTFSDQDRQANPALPAGGGYINFDIEFDVPADQLERVRQELQPRVDAEWNRLKKGTAEEQARPGVAGTTASPPVQFAAPTWTGGKVSMDAPQSAQLVAGRVAEGVPSLLSGNVAVFSMDLTPEGATFFQKTLVAPDGTGASDLSPIQVSYDLTFWARLPPVRIHITADSSKISQYVRKQLEGRGVDNCTTYDFDHTDIDTSSALMSGAITVQIDTGSGSLADDVIEELRKYSLELVKQMVQANFFTSTPPAGSGDIPSPDSASTTPSTNTKKYLKQHDECAKVHIEFNLEQRTVVEWPIHPQGTLQTFFRGMSASKLSQFVREIGLDDDFFKSLQLTVRAFSDFSDKELAAVEVQVDYQGTDENGQHQEKTSAFTFTSTDSQSWKVALIGSEHEYRYAYRPIFVGHDPGPFTDWLKSVSPQLNVSVPNPGKIDLDVLTGDVDFANLVDQVQVHLSYADPELSVGAEESVVILTPTRTQDHYHRAIYGVWRKPVQYTTRFRLKSGEVREDGGTKSTNGPQILINQAFGDVLQVNLLPAGNGWDDVIQVIVDVRYEDPANDYIVAGPPIQFRTPDEYKTWRVYLKNKDLKDFKYRWTTVFKTSADPVTTQWQTATGDQTVPIVVDRHGFKVAILADLLDFTTCPVTEMTMHYTGVAAGPPPETFTFRDKTPQSWIVDVPPGAPVQYTSQITYNPANHDPVVLPPASGTDTAVVIPPYRPAMAGKLSVQVLPPLIDFAATPIVAVDLKYDDNPNNVHQVGALTFTDKTSQIWAVDVKDVNSKTFGYRLTYYTADGNAHAKDFVYGEVPRIIIPRYVPASG